MASNGLAPPSAGVPVPLTASPPPPPPMQVAPIGSYFGGGSATDATQRRHPQQLQLQQQQHASPLNPALDFEALPTLTSDAWQRCVVDISIVDGRLLKVLRPNIITINPF